MGNYKIYLEDVCITDTFNYEYFERVRDVLKKNLKDGIMIRSYVHTINR